MPHKRSDQVYTKIPRDQLHTMVNKPIHLAWANPGAVWILKEIRDDNTIVCETPKNRKQHIAKATDAVYVRQYDPNWPKGYPGWKPDCK